MRGSPSIKKHEPSQREKPYSVGYGKPPDAFKYKPGQCGNPNGRKLGEKNLDSLIKEGLSKRFKVKGSKKTVTAREAIAHQLISKAIKGDLKAIDYIMNHTKNDHQPPRRLETITKDMSQQQAADVYMRLVRAGQGSD